MATQSPPPPTIPSIEIPVIDPKTGKMDVDWYKYFIAWDRINRIVRTEV